MEISSGGCCCGGEDEELFVIVNTIFMSLSGFVRREMIMDGRKLGRKQSL